AVVPMLQGAVEANTKTDTLYITSPLDVCMDYKLRLVVNNTITVDILIPFDEVEYTSTESGSKAYHDEIYENLLNRVADEINASSISSYVSAVVEEMDLLGGEILDAGNSVVDTQYKETVLAIKNLNFGTTTLRASDDHNTENFVASERLSKLSYHVTRPNNLGKSAIISAYQCVLFDLTGSLAQADCNLWGMPKAAASPKMNTLTAVNQHGTILHYNGSKYPYEVPNKTFVAHLNIYTRPVVLAGAMENDYHIRISNMKGSFAVDFVLTWAEASAGVHKKIIIGEQLRTLEHNERVITLNVTDPEDHNAGISGDAYIVYY
ncbi:MAG: hypothetical protein KAH32_02945, partial [Chlamydiia bacterium]|nr:hypothetical protein [Chlamydiia bacterium]